MAYARQADIVELYGQKLLDDVSDRDDGDGVADAATVESALEAASALIDMYVSALYPVPITPTPPAFKQLAVDIAVHHMAQSHALMTENIHARYEDAIKHLARIGKGEAGLGIPTDPETGEPGTGTGAGRPRTYQAGLA
jgi:phage gp36-like protein